jgi:hypothetical protein
MSNGQQDDSVHFKEEETELRTGTGACLLVTILESKEREKGSNNDSESSLSGLELLFCGFCHSILSLNKGEGSAV